MYTKYHGEFKLLYREMNCLTKLGIFIPNSCIVNECERLQTTSRKTLQGHPNTIPHFPQFRYHIRSQAARQYIATTHCVTTQKNAVLIYFAAEA
jgi:hypothetical protein